MSELQGYRDDFLAEADEILARLSQGFVALERTPDSRDLLDSIYRGLHTLKGMAAMMGFQRLAMLAHVAEDLLQRMKEGVVEQSPEIVDALLAAIDLLSAMVDDVRKGGTGDLPSDGLAQQLASFRPVARERVDTVPEMRAGTRRSQGAEATVRVGIERLDGLLDLVGEVVIARNQILQVSRQLQEDVASGGQGAEAGVAELADVLGGFNRLVGDLQESVLAIRMLPVGSVLQRFPRLVRDLCRKLGKRCEVIIEGDDTELDRAVLELLKDSLVHLVRNAIDHGIEHPEERRLAGKPEVATLRLSARPEEGSILIEIADDGRGIATERVLESARGLGLISMGDDRLSTGDVLQMIFEPGVTTARELSDVSGRGVGLDAVRVALEELGGQIELASEPGLGCSFKIKLPLTLAIMKSLLVRVGEEIYGVPLPAIVETQRIEREALREAGGRMMLVVRDEVLPVIDLAELVGRKPLSGRFRYAVIVVFAGRRAALLVDALEGQEEVVIKPLGAYLRGGCPGVGGATVLGDGQVVLILDIGAMLDLTRKADYLIGASGRGGTGLEKEWLS